MKIGILGGGQLGLMFQQNACSYPYDIYYMDRAKRSPVCTASAKYSVGEILDYEDVLRFGEDKDILSIEIENVNLEALYELQSRGKTVIPDPRALEIIRDKGTQRRFYSELALPSPRYEIHDSCRDLDLELDYPVMQKYRQGGYDGKGVVRVESAEAMAEIADRPSLFEEVVDIAEEIAVQVFKSQDGSMVSYPCVKFVADPKLNLLDYLIFPANFGASLEKEAKEIAESIAKNLPGAGVFSVEMFVDTDGNLLVNETAPRVHNSGHSTIEASASSQFDQFLRILVGLPLSSAPDHRVSGILNLLGPIEGSGAVNLMGLDDILAQEETYLHWYHKADSKPGRKLGHLTFLGANEEEVVKKINFAKATLKIEVL